MTNKKVQQTLEESIQTQSKNNCKEELDGEEWE